MNEERKGQRKVSEEIGAEYKKQSSRGIIFKNLFIDLWKLTDIEKQYWEFVMAANQ